MTDESLLLHSFVFPHIRYTLKSQCGCTEGKMQSRSKQTHQRGNIHPQILKSERRPSYRVLSTVWTFLWSLSLSRLTSLSGCRLHSSACQIQPRPVVRLSVHSRRTEVRHSWVFSIPAGYCRYPVVSVRNDNMLFCEMILIWRTTWWLLMHYSHPEGGQNN